MDGPTLWPVASSLAGPHGNATACGDLAHPGTSMGTMMFLLVSGWLVFLMQAGFAMLTAGSVGTPSVTNMLFLNLMDSVVGIIVWFAVGYAFAYGDNLPSGSGAISSMHFFGATLDPCDLAFWFYQWTFSATVTAIVSGAVAGRITLTGYISYTVAITGIIYPAVVHWAWSIPGWLATGEDGRHGDQGGYADFAGSGVVHACGGTCALVGAYFCGPRGVTVTENARLGDDPKASHSLPLVHLGTVLLFFGFFGFNGGSVLKMNTVDNAISASLACVTTSLAGSGGGVAAILIHRYKNPPHWSLVEGCNGALAGMVAICASADAIDLWAAWVLGALGAVAFKLLGSLVHRCGIDDVCDAVGLHLGGGITGVLLRPILANKHSALHWDAVAAQILLWNVIGIVVIVVWSAGCSIVVFWSLKSFGLLRIPDATLNSGIDEEVHGERSYVGLDHSGRLRKEANRDGDDDAALLIQ